MKLTFIFLALALLAVSSLCIAMENPDSDLRQKVGNAFYAFDISSQQYKYHLSIDSSAQTPEPSVARWQICGNQIHLTRDIMQNADLSTFALHCSAAYIKNHGSTKVNAALWTSGFLNIALIPAALILSRNHPYHCHITCAASLAAILAAVPLDLVNRITRAIENNLATSAFTQACQKLIETKNYKPLAAYYAYAKKIEHMPVGQENQLAIIEDILRNDYKLIKSEPRRQTLEVQILDLTQKDIQARDGQDRYVLCTRATYP